ncbi:hypothetical protein GCM10010429_47660 [Micromonospora olivasterospora]
MVWRRSEMSGGDPGNGWAVSQAFGAALVSPMLLLRGGLLRHGPGLPEERSGPWSRIRIHL